jgi:hypothetical protein
VRYTIQLEAIKFYAFISLILTDRHKHSHPQRLLEPKADRSGRVCISHSPSRPCCATITINHSLISLPCNYSYNAHSCRKRSVMHAHYIYSDRQLPIPIEHKHIFASHNPAAANYYHSRKPHKGRPKWMVIMQRNLIAWLLAVKQKLR